MVSLVDESKATTPRSWRTAVTSCRRPRNASSASNPTLSTGQNDYRTTGNTGNSPSGFAMPYPPSGRGVHAVAAKLLRKGRELAAEEGPLHVGVGQKLFSRASQHDRALFEHVAA